MAASCRSSVPYIVEYGRGSAIAESGGGGGVGGKNPMGALHRVWVAHGTAQAHSTADLASVRAIYFAKRSPLASDISGAADQQATASTNGLGGTMGRTSRIFGGLRYNSWAQMSENEDAA